MKFIKLILVVCLSLGILGCSNAPVTGRRQLMVVPNSTMFSMSFSQYNSFLKENKISKDKEKRDLVKKVGKNIQNAVEAYYREIGESSHLNGYAWEFNVVESKDINAWCMPGGKIVVYTGLFKLAQTEEELSVVIGHEVAHAVARHGNERMSQVLLTQLGGVALNAALEEQPEKTKALWLGVYGAGANFGIVLPYSRIHEYEADYLGMIFMAKAGYHPYYAVRFWERMEEYSAENKKSSMPEFLSTHPSGANRIARLKEKHSEVIEKYYTGK